jgi:hypothetical protein
MADSVNVFYDFLVKANNAGFWSAISAIAAVSGVIIAKNYLKTRSFTRGLNFFINHSRENGDFPNRIKIEIRNYSGKTVVLTNPYFKFGKFIEPDESASCDSYTKEYEIKFSKPSSETFDDVDILLRHKEKTETWIPIEPSENDEKIKNTLESHSVGILYCYAIWLGERPKAIRIRKKV